MLRDQLNRWIQQGYVETSQAWVTCNPFWVDKPNGGKRTCIDHFPIIDNFDPNPKVTLLNYRAKPRSETLLASSWTFELSCIPLDLKAYQ